MNDLQEDKMSAYEAVWGVLNADENKALWIKNSDFAGLVETMGRLKSEILEEGAKQETIITGIAENKKQIRTALIDAAMKVVNGAVAHAIITNDMELKNSIDYSKRELMNARDTELADKTGLIYAIAYPLRESLAARYVTAEDIERVNALTLEYVNEIPAPRMAIIERKGASDSIKMKIKEMDDLLYNKIDLIIRSYGYVKKSFEEEYYGARKLVRTGVRHTGAWVKGRVVMAGTDSGVSGARVMMPEKKRERVTDEGGYFKFLLKKRCKVSLVAEATGYKRGVKGPIEIVPGKGMEVEIELENC
jgi:hypothetical protein